MLSGDGPGIMTKGMRMLRGERGGEQWQNGCKCGGVMDKEMKEKQM